MLNLMRDFCRATRGVIVTTHDVDEIVPEIDRVILLEQGRILVDGPKDEGLTRENLSRLYQVDLRVDKNRGWYHLR